MSTLSTEYCTVRYQELLYGLTGTLYRLGIISHEIM